MPTNTLGAEIRQWREAKDMKLQQAALLIGVAIATLFEWEADRSLPSPMAVPGLAAAMGREVGDLAVLVARERSRRQVARARKGRLAGHRCSRRQPNTAGAA